MENEFVGIVAFIAGFVVASNGIVITLFDIGIGISWVGIVIGRRGKQVIL